MTLPPDDSHLFPSVPLKGHICSMRVGDRKHYWRVEGLIEEARSLVPFEKSVAELIDALGNSSWFKADEKPTIRAILAHVERAQNSDLRFPVILAADGRLMDGAHRLVRAKLQGLETISVVQFVYDPSPDYV
jgi:hypothetical protein